MSSAPTREVARRAFAREFNDATYTFKESDDDRAPVYALLPTGQRANRFYIVGTATEVKDVGEDGEYWQARVVDTAGDPFYVYAGQYQPDAAATLRQLEPPAYVGIVGKPRTYTNDDGETNVSLRPEHVAIVDEDTRRKWAERTADLTLERIKAMQNSDDHPDAHMAREKYDIDLEPYKKSAIATLESLTADTGSTDESDEDDTSDAKTTSEADDSEASEQDTGQPKGEVVDQESLIDTEN